MLNDAHPMLVQCSSDADLMLIQYSLDYAVTMLTGGSLRLFGCSLQVILETSSSLFNSHRMHGWCSTIPCPMLVQCSSNAHLMLIQYSFVALLQCSLKAHWYCLSGLCILLRWFCKLLWRSFNSHSMHFGCSTYARPMPPQMGTGVQCSSNAHPMLI